MEPQATTELCIAGSKLEEATALLLGISDVGHSDSDRLEKTKAIELITDAKATISNVYDRLMEEDDKQ